VLTDPKLSSALVELRQVVKNNVANTFYSPLMLRFASTEDLFTASLTEFIYSNEEKMNGFLFGDGNFRLEDPYHRQYNYNLPVSITTLYKSRYGMFLELFRYLYDFMAMGLSVRINYYEAFLRKAAEFTDFFKDIKETKLNLHGQSFSQSVKTAAVRDKVAKLRTLIEDRERLVAKKSQELREVELELKVNQDEIDHVVEQRDAAIDETLAHIEKVTGSEFMHIVNGQGKFNGKEQHLLRCFAILVEKTDLIEGYDGEKHGSYFHDRDELIDMLDERRGFNFDEPCYNHFKELTLQYASVEFRDKPLLQLLYQYFSHLLKKLNVRNSMSNTYSVVKQLRAQIDQVQFTLSYSQNYIRDKRRDLEEVEKKYSQLTGQEKQLSLKIEEAEISHMRTEHIIEQIERYAHKVMGKLVKARKRLETLLGDSLILSSTVVFLGAFSIKERKAIRKEMAEYLNTTTGGFIKCGHLWIERSGINNSKVFRSVLKDFGLKGSDSNNGEHMILSSIPQGILSQETLVESIFTLMFSPSCPQVIDPTGQLQEFFCNNLMSNLQMRTLSASDQGANAQLESVLRGQGFAILNDLSDCSSPLFGMSQNSSLLSRLAHTTHNGFEFDPETLKNPFAKSLI